MSSLRITAIFIVLSLALRHSLAVFFLHPVGPFNATERIQLQQTASICPNETSTSSGFNLQCSFTPEAQHANFYVNGAWVRNERVVPFFIAGDWAGKVWKWDDYPETAKVTCRANDGREDTISISFTCPDGIADSSATPSPSTSPASIHPSETTATSPTTSPSFSNTVPTPSRTPVAAQDFVSSASPTPSTQLSSSTPPPSSPTSSTTPMPPSTNPPNPSPSPIPAPPASLFLRPTGQVDTPSMRLTDGISICPSTGFGGKGVTVLCRPSPDSTWARFYVNGKMVRVERKMPYYISGDRKGVAFAWRNIPTGEVNIRCVLSDGAENSVTVQMGC